MALYKYKKHQKANNYPFWIIIFNYLGLEDIEKWMQVCKSFNRISQDERILEKFVDSDDEEESESEDDEEEKLPPMK